LVWGLVLSCGWFESQPKKPPKPSILFLVTDTTRADLFETADTPQLDALGASPLGQAVPFAYSPSSWTSPSVLSMFTGKSVREHGWDFPIAQEMIKHNMEYPAISDDVQTLAEVLQQHDFQTYGLFANRFLKRDLGFQRGFETWEYMGDTELVTRSQELLTTVDTGHSHFFYVHFFGPHQPVEPTEERLEKYGVKRSRLSPNGGLGHKYLHRSPRYVELYRTLYKGVIEDTDHRMGQVIDAFLERFPNGRIVMTSDHGEMIGEHQEIGHKSGLYQEVIHVPLVMYGWRDEHGEQQGTVDKLFSLDSIADWITDSVGIDGGWSSQWEQYAKGQKGALAVAQRDGDLALITVPQQKLIVDYPMTIRNRNFYLGTPVTHTFALPEDPQEIRPIQDNALTTSLQEQLAIWQQSHPQGVADGQTNQTNRTFIEDLRTLGYVGE